MRQRASGEFPAAHASARQGDVDGSDPAERHHADVEPCEQFQFQLAQQLRLRRRCAPLLPKGTILKITSWYDNTRANKNNPIRISGWAAGDRTVDEMGHAWVNITYMSDEDYQAELERRKAPVSSSAGAP
jgi:hypothetical protein